MKIYVAGNLREEENRDKLEDVNKICEEFGETYLPHRDMGIFEDGMDPVAVLDWKGISSGTAWELGYAYAKNVKVIALVEDKKTIHKDYRICVMCNNKDVIFVENLKELKKELERFKY
ncbi:nucleoside 2-deoxyribosyltransferase [Candidatus Woesearchaeota archaeon]|nr:nucleoside 2-deoxyribosyltransferase [Candidatus Woesearchaeota archaeon]